MQLFCLSWKRKRKMKILVHIAVIRRKGQIEKNF